MWRGSSITELYVNGVHEPNVDHLYLDNVPALGATAIEHLMANGKWESGAPVEHSDFKHDDIRINTRALSAQEILDLYNELSA